VVVPLLVGLGLPPLLQEDPEIHEEITPAVVACGRAHSACITKKGHLMTWGCSAHGQLGYEEDETPSVACPLRAMGLTPRTRFISLACGDEHTLAISEHGSVWACGLNDKGQLGLGNMDNIAHLFPVPALR
jgi:alpha-tubulin suppressor-like RCC1 family protein